MIKTFFILFFTALFSASSFANRVWVVHQSHQQATDKGNGTAAQPFKTISQAALVAQPGDTVLVFEGVYRERVAPARGGEEGRYIVYKAAPNNHVAIKGSDVWTQPWKKIEGEIYSGKLTNPSFEQYNPYLIPLAGLGERFSLGQIFCNGDELNQVDSLHHLKNSPGTWMLSYDTSEILIHYPAGLYPTSIHQAEIEYTVRQKIFSPHKRGMGYIHVEGFEITHCANQFPLNFYNAKGYPQSGAISCRSGHHWVIRKNKIHHVKSLAIDCGYEGVLDNEGTDEPRISTENIGWHLIEHNEIHDCGTGGIHGLGQHYTVIRYNRFLRTNNRGHNDYETGAIKVHHFYNGLIEGNILMDNDCEGIWLDNMWYGTRVTRNVIFNSFGHGGIFIELGEGPCLVDNNIIAFTRSGDGIYMHDASGVTLAHNLLYCNMHFGILMHTATDRPTLNKNKERWMSSTANNTILNNVFIGNYRGRIALPIVNERDHSNVSDYNLFIGSAPTGRTQWSGLEENLFLYGFQSGTESECENTSLIDFKLWQFITGFDKNSHVPQSNERGGVGTLYMPTQSLLFRFQRGSIFQQMYCPPIPGVDYDLYGEKLKSEKVLPGPFQTYPNRDGRFVLIPSVITR